MAWSFSLNSLLTGFVFSILAISSVDSIECELSSCASETCSSPTACTASKGCFNQIQIFDTPSPATNQTYKEKGCYNDTCNDVEYSATLGDQRKFSYVNRCCTSENCNKENLTVSPASTEANGVKCFGYYVEPGFLGSPTSLSCTGKETKCGLVIGTEVGNSNPFAFVVAGAGCMTENACNLNVIALNNTNIFTLCSDYFAISSPGSSVPDSAGIQPTSISTRDMMVAISRLSVTTPGSFLGVFLQ
ncbi:hypothetical protein HispidOSU_015687 [Sigmodon hispidus]